MRIRPRNYVPTERPTNTPAEFTRVSRPTAQRQYMDVVATHTLHREELQPIQSNNKRLKTTIIGWLSNLRMGFKLVIHFMYTRVLSFRLSDRLLRNNRFFADKVRIRKLASRAEAVIFILVFLASMFTWFKPHHSEAAVSQGFKGMAVYDDDFANSPTSPRQRFWNASGNDFTNETDTVKYNADIRASETEASRLEASPTRNEFIYVGKTLNDTLFAQVWRGGAWTDLGILDTGMATNSFVFDVAYENTSGDALIVYEDSTTSNTTLMYRIWDGTTLSGATTFDYCSGSCSVTGTPTSGVADWIELEPDIGSNNILMGCKCETTTTPDILGADWTGSAWQHKTIINAAGVDGEPLTRTMDIAWEGTSGEGMIAYGTGTTTDFSTYTVGGGFTDGANMVNTVGEIVWLDLEGDVDSNYIGASTIDTISSGGSASSDYNVDMWNGSDWTTIAAPTEDTDINASAPSSIAMSWEQTSSDQLLFTWRDGTTSEVQLRYMIFDISAGQFQAIDDDAGAALCALTGADGTTQQVTALTNAENANGPCTGAGTWGSASITSLFSKAETTSDDIMVIGSNSTAPFVIEGLYWDGGADGFLAQTTKMASIEADAASADSFDFEFKTATDAFAKVTQSGYIWENDDEDQVGGDNYDDNTQQAAGSTAITGVRRGERLGLRMQIKNTGTGSISPEDNLSLFYDRSDNVWSRLGTNTPLDVTAGTCDSSTLFDCDTVFQANDVGTYTAMAIDKKGVPWISFYENDTGACDNTPATGCTLNVAQYVGSGGNCVNTAWACMVVDNGISTSDYGKYNSIAFDASGKAWISYYDGSGGNLRVAQYVGNAGTGCTGSTVWTCTSVEVTNDVGQYTDIMFDKTNTAWISYYDVTNTALKVARFVGSGSATCAGGSAAWDCVTVDNTSTARGTYSSIALNAKGNPIVSYYDSTGATQALIVAEYAETGGGCTSSAWACVTVDNTGTDTGTFTSIAADPSGNPWISFYDTTNSSLRVATRASFGSACTGGGWNCGAVDADSDDTGQYSSIAFDPAGNAWISYYDDTLDQLMYARYVGSGGSGCGASGSSAFSCSAVDNSGTTTGQYTSIAFDLLGRPMISYNDLTNANLQVASLTRQGELLIAPALGGDSGDSLIESHAEMSSVSDTTTGRDDADCISGSDTWNNGKLFETDKAAGIYLGQGSITAQCTEVEFVIDTSQATLGTTYRIIIASQDSWLMNGTSWRGPAAITNYATLTIESAMTLRGSKDTNLVMSNCADTDWGCATVADFGANVLYYTRIGIDKSGVPWMTFVDDTADRIYVAHYVGGTSGTGCTGGSSAWTCEILTTAATDLYMGMTMDRNGYPAIVYQNSGRTLVYIARYVGSGGSGCTGATNAAQWTCESVYNGVNMADPSIAFDNNNNPFITMNGINATDLVMARYVGTGGSNCGTTDNPTRWYCEIVDSAGGGESNIEFDSKGQAWISYIATNLKVATYVGSSGSGCGSPTNSGTWNCVTVDSPAGGARYSDLAIGSGDSIWISYGGVTNTELRSAHYVPGASGTCTAGNWVCYQVDNNKDGASDTYQTNSIAVDADGNPWISYEQYSATSDCDTSPNDNAFECSLKVARFVSSGGNCTSTAWNCSIVQNTTQWNGYCSSITFDQQGNAWIAFSDRTTFFQQVAKFDVTSLKGYVHVPAGPGRSTFRNDGRYRLSAGLSARPSTCSGITDLKGFCGIASDDSDFDSITAKVSERPTFNFVYKHTTNAAIPTVTWTGRSDVSCATDNIILQAYIFGTTNAWSTIGTYNNANCTSTDASLSATLSNPEINNYTLEGGDGYYMFFRVYQIEPSSGTETLKTDSFTMTFENTGGMMRHGNRFTNFTDSAGFDL